MENQENKEEKKTCNCKQDAKTFFIAFLTAVIVVAVYHFGCGLCRIYDVNAGGDDQIPVCQRFVLVPVQALPPAGLGMDAPHPRHHGEFRGRRRMERKPDQPGMKQPEGKRPDMPKKPAPEQK